MAGAGGAAGSGGSGGTGGVTPLQVPDCVANLLAPCPTTGACMYEPTDAGTSWCFDSGVKIAWSVVPDARVCAGGGITVAQIFKPDGSACYSFESYLDGVAACEAWSYRWKDANGQVVATGLATIPQPQLTITCTSGSSARCTGAAAECCGVGPDGTPACTGGMQTGVTCNVGTCP